MSITFRAALLFIISTLWLSCKTNESETSPVEEDTRILVRAAFDSIDPMKIPVAVNKIRVGIIKNQFDNEKDPGKRINLGLQYALELLRNGETAEALNVYSAATNFIAQNNSEMDGETKRNLYSFIGITFMRHGEIENCLKNHNHESCIIPIQGKGVHEFPYGSTNAISIYEKSLAEFPDDLETKYLLNLAYMTLGQYPDKVPPQYRIDPSWFTSKTKIKPFEDVAPKLGINLYGLA
ncbi:MAG TPA: tetratricopeptide repeat protein, partial [Saprospiraceae bacterium]|nr:tetratricopeptide repeat protein [Saprospiraceae bacterium]